MARDLLFDACPAGIVLHLLHPPAGGHPLGAVFRGLAAKLRPRRGLDQDLHRRRPRSERLVVVAELEMALLVPLPAAEHAHAAGPDRAGPRAAVLVLRLEPDLQVVVAVD